MSRLSTAALLLVTFAAAGWTEARASDVAAGRDIAERLCSPCHAIGLQDESPHDEAPPFRSFADKWPLESLEEALAEGITVGHPDMPEFVLQPDEIASFIAYLESLDQADQDY